MSETEKSARRERIVMALGIATVVLFSANLLAMVAKHFWPDLRETALFKSESQAIAEVPDHAVEFHAFADFDHKLRHVHRKPHRIVIRKPHATAMDITFNTDSFQADLERLERDLAHEMDLLNRDISSIQSSKPFVYSITKNDGDVSVKFSGDFDFDGEETFKKHQEMSDMVAQKARVAAARSQAEVDRVAELREQLVKNH